MPNDRDEKPRLGKGTGREVNGTKPYAGEGGMKKLLARRKQEEEDERRKEKAEAMDDGRAEEEEKPKKQSRSYGADSIEEKAGSAKEQRYQDMPPAVPPASTFGSSISSPANYEKSSLRVGRTRTSRNHLSRPASRPNNRFSAIYDEEESDDQMADERGADQIALEEAAKKVPVFEVPAGFSFGKEVCNQRRTQSMIDIYFISQTSPIQHDLTNAKEPPVSSLPFTFTKPGAMNGSAASSVSPPPLIKEQPEQPPKTSSFFAQPPQAPSITLTTSTPEPPKVTIADAPAPRSVTPNFFANPEPPKRPPSASLPETTDSGVPNFFANFAVSSNPASVSSPPTSSGVPNFFTTAAATNKPDSPTPPQISVFSPAHATPTKDVENPLWEGEKLEKSVSSVTEPSKVPKLSSPSLFGAPPTATNKNTIFGSGGSHPSAIFGSSVSIDPAKDVEATPTASVFGDVPLSKPAESTPSPFSFANPAEADKLRQQPAPAPEPPKVSEICPEPIGTAKPPPLFAESPFGGLIGSTTGTTAAEVSKPTFSFAQPTPGASTPAETAKPLFGTESGVFSFGQRPSSAPTPDARPSPANPFLFGAAPSTPPAGAEKKAPFSFGTSPVTAVPTTNTPFSFGPPSGSSHGTDVSHKPFAFGNTTASARPVTPPKNEQEFRMEESPTRETNGKASEVPKPALGGFSFGAPSASSTGSFGQSNQNGQGGASPFLFGGSASTLASNMFAAKPEERQDGKGLGFSGFGQNTPSGFSFGQNPADAAPTPTSSAGGFSFGQAPVAAPTTTSFAFGGPATASNPFSQSASNTGSTPNSPSTFNQSTPFSFTSPTAPSNPFAFGSSQPASPATDGDMSLPQAPGTPGGGFTFGGISAPQSTSPFQAPPASLPPISGSLFTIGSAPPPAPSNAGRAIKKLPNRRTGKR